MHYKIFHQIEACVPGLFILLMYAINALCIHFLLSIIPDVENISKRIEDFSSMCGIFRELCSE